MRWEHKQTCCPLTETQYDIYDERYRKTRIIDPVFHDEGEDGWELVSTIIHNNHQWFYWKRPVKE